VTDYPDTDPFWVENRAQFLAEKSTAADPSACGTCRSNVAAGEPVEHDECAQRATLLHAPDHPYYEILAGFSLEENAKLPARFHVPVFDDCGVPNSWLCAVCQEEGVVTGWPCATATKYGTQVFTPLDKAETAREKQAARIAELEDEIVRLRDQQAKDDDEFVQATAERDRYRLAWQSARERAQAYGEGILRVVKDRESYQQWLKQEQAATEQLRARIAELEKAEKPSAPQHYDKVPDPLDGCHWCACGNRWPCKQAGEAAS
jgi:cell division protein FtsB